HQVLRVGTLSSGALQCKKELSRCREVSFAREPPARRAPPGGRVHGFEPGGVFAAWPPTSRQDGRREGPNLSSSIATRMTSDDDPAAGRGPIEPSPLGAPVTRTERIDR